MNTQNNSKKIAYSVLAIILLATIFYGISKYTNKSGDDISEYSVSQLNELGEAQRKKALENKLKEYENNVANLAPDANSSDKYSAYIVLSDAQIALGLYDESLKSLESIPEDKRNSKRAYYQFAQIYKAKNDLFKAMEYANLALEKDSSDVPSWLLYLDSASNLNNQELDAKYRQAIPATKSNKDIMISYAKFSERIGDKATAIAAWETALNGDPANASTYEAEIARLRQ